MYKHVLIDFDGTLIKNNSSRVLEKHILLRADGWQSVLLKLLFFNRLFIWFDKFFSFMSIYFFDYIDARLLLFLKLTKDVYKYKSKDINLDVVKSLLINKDLYNNYKSDYPIILSKGLDTIILECIKFNKLKRLKIVSSKIDFEPKVNFELMNNAKKITYMREYLPCLYLTDDVAEVNYIRKYSRIHIVNVRKKVFDAVSIFVLELDKNNE